MEHLHSGNDICLANLMLFYPDLPLDKLAESEKAHALEVRETRKAGDHRSYSGILRRQSEGPLKAFVIPEGHRRVCHQYPLYDMYLRDSRSAREVDFVHVLKHMDDFLEDALEVVPLDMLAEFA